MFDALASCPVAAALLPLHRSPALALALLFLLVVGLVSRLPHTRAVTAAAVAAAKSQPSLPPPKPLAAAAVAAWAIVAAAVTTARRRLPLSYSGGAGPRGGFGPAAPDGAGADAADEAGRSREMRFASDSRWVQFRGWLPVVRRAVGRSGAGDDSASGTADAIRRVSPQCRRQPPRYRATGLEPSPPPAAATAAGAMAAASPSVAIGVDGGSAAAGMAAITAAVAAAAASPSPRPPVRRYVPLTRLCCTRVKIHGAAPELIAVGYRERIAEAVAAAGGQLEGVYVRRGCIELVVDAHVVHAAAGVEGLPAVPPSVTTVTTLVRHIDVDELIRLLHLPSEQSDRRSHTATTWQLPAPLVPASAMAEYDGGAAASLVLTVRPCVVYTGGGGNAAAMASATAAAPADVLAAGAVGCSADLSLHVWVPVPPGFGTGMLPLPPPVVSARIDGEFQAVKVDWRGAEVVRTPENGGTTPQGGAAAALNLHGRGSCRVLFSGTGHIRDGPTRGSVGLLLFQAACPGGGGDGGDGGGSMTVAAAAAPVAGSSAAGLEVAAAVAESRPVPVLCVDDPWIAAEICHAAGDGCPATDDDDGAARREGAGVDDAGAEDVGALEAFVVDLGVFLSGAQRCRGGGLPAPHPRHDDQEQEEQGQQEGRHEEQQEDDRSKLSELEALGCHLEAWLRRTGPDAWPATLARLRRDLRAIAERLRRATPPLPLPASSEPPPPMMISVLPGERPRALAAAAEVGAALPLVRCNGGGEAAAADEERGGGDGGGGASGVVIAGSASARGGGGECGAASSSSGGGGGAGPSSAGGMLRCRAPTTAAASAAPMDVPAGPAVAAGSSKNASNGAGSGSGRFSCRTRWLRRAGAGGAAMYDTFKRCRTAIDSCLMDPGYQEFLTDYCAMQAPMLDAMFFVSVGSVLLRTWQEDPAWRTRPPAAFIAHAAPCLLTLATSVVTAASRPLLLARQRHHHHQDNNQQQQQQQKQKRWARLVRGCMLPRYLCFLAGLALLGSGLCGPPPPAISAYHQRGVSVMMGEGVVLSATLVIMPAAAALLAVIRIPAHVAVWIRVGAYDTIGAAVAYAVVLAICSVATNLLLHVVLLVQYRRRRAAAAAAAANLRAHRKAD